MSQMSLSCGCDPDRGVTCQIHIQQPSPAGGGSQETLRYCRCGYGMPPVTQERYVCVIDYGECVCRPSLPPERAVRYCQTCKRELSPHCRCIC